MEVRVTEVVDQAGRLRVAFESECGAGEAYWVGPAPVPGDHRFVEFELRRVLTTERDLFMTDQSSGFRKEGAQLVLVARVEVSERSGLVSLSCGHLRLDVEVAGPLPVVGRRYQFAANDLEAYDCEY